MNLSKYTPGPWRVDLERECPNVHIVGPDGRSVAVVIQRDPHPTTGQGITREQAIANANLMAASQDLLEALLGERRLPFSDGSESSQEERSAVYRATDDAIAKAMA